MTNQQRKDREKIQFFPKPGTDFKPKSADELAKRDNTINQLKAELRAAKAAPAPATYTRQESIWDHYMGLPPGPERQSYREAHHAQFEGENLPKFVAFRKHG